MLAMAAMVATVTRRAVRHGRVREQEERGEDQGESHFSSSRAARKRGSRFSVKAL